MEAARNHRRVIPAAIQITPQVSHQLRLGGRPFSPNSIALNVPVKHLVRIQIRTVGWQEKHLHPHTMSIQPVANRLGPVHRMPFGLRELPPLLIKKTRVEKALRIHRQSLGGLHYFLLKRIKVGVLSTGSEVCEGRISDQFEPIIRRKVESLGGLIMDVLFLLDDEERIAKEALDLVIRGADINYHHRGYVCGS